MATTRNRAFKLPAFFMLGLLLVSLWVSAAHQHDADEPHPPTSCTVCVQLHSAHFASSHNSVVVIGVEPAASHYNQIPLSTLASTTGSYHSRAPPQSISLHP